MPSREPSSAFNTSLDYRRSNFFVSDGARPILQTPEMDKQIKINKVHCLFGVSAVPASFRTLASRFQLKNEKDISLGRKDILSERFRSLVVDLARSFTLFWSVSHQFHRRLVWIGHKNCNCLISQVSFDLVSLLLRIKLALSKQGIEEVIFDFLRSTWSDLIVFFCNHLNSRERPYYWTRTQLNLLWQN